MLEELIRHTPKTFRSIAYFAARPSEFRYDKQLVPHNIYMYIYKYTLFFFSFIFTILILNVCVCVHIATLHVSPKPPTNTATLHEPHTSPESRIFCLGETSELRSTPPCMTFGRFDLGVGAQCRGDGGIWSFAARFGWQSLFSHMCVLFGCMPVGLRVSVRV